MNAPVPANGLQASNQRGQPERTGDELNAEVMPAITNIPETSIDDADLSLTKTLLLSASVTLANLFLGFSYHTVTVTLNQLAEDLKIAEGNLQWAANSHLLAVGCTSLVAGRAADITGRKPIFLAGIATFGIFVLIASFMRNEVGFFICRALSGIGAAMLSVSNAGLVVENVRLGRKRSLLIAICNGGMVVGNAIGLGATGPLVEATQWRAAYWVLAGMAFMTFAVTVFGVKGRAISLSRADKRIDWLGAILFTSGFVLLFFSISQARAARKGWASNYIIAMFVLSFFLIGCASGWQRYLEAKTTFPPLLRPSILTRRKGRLMLICLVIFCCLGAHNGFIFCTTIFYQRYQRLSPSQFAIRLLPGPILGIVLNVSVGLFAGLIPSYWFLSAGALATGLSNLLYAIRREPSTYWTYEFVAQFFSYGAFALSLSAGYVYVARVVPPAEVAVGNSCLQLFVLLGAVCGAALSTLIFSNVGKLDVRLQGLILDELSRKGLLHGLRAAHGFWAGMCFFAAILTLLCLRDADEADAGDSGKGDGIQNGRGSHGKENVKRNDSRLSGQGAVGATFSGKTQTKWDGNSEKHLSGEAV